MSVFISVWGTSDEYETGEKYCKLLHHLWRVQPLPSVNTLNTDTHLCDAQIESDGRVGVGTDEKEKVPFYLSPFFLKKKIVDRRCVWHETGSFVTDDFSFFTPTKYSY